METEDNSSSTSSSSDCSNTTCLIGSVSDRNQYQPALEFVEDIRTAGQEKFSSAAYADVSETCHLQCFDHVAAFDTIIHIRERFVMRLAHLITVLLPIVMYRWYPSPANAPGRTTYFNLLT
mmetsp:Transcript_22750/g.27495  ORF Transcript_22750/g.27495 Transcript_22750/m.27495 type:complete len:121 (+) Transcript_22750:278-640(+)